MVCSLKILIIGLLVAVSPWNPLVGSYEIKVGLMLPKTNAYLKPAVGFGTSAGAITLALQRIRDEKLLEGANFS